jgi:hypothetical protein
MFCAKDPQFKWPPLLYISVMTLVNFGAKELKKDVD